jgi:hypothetical protein
LHSTNLFRDVTTVNGIQFKLVRNISPVFRIGKTSAHQKTSIHKSASNLRRVIEDLDVKDAVLGPGKGPNSSNGVRYIEMKVNAMFGSTARSGIASPPRSGTLLLLEALVRIVEAHGFPKSRIRNFGAAVEDRSQGC